VKKNVRIGPVDPKVM